MSAATLSMGALWIGVGIMVGACRAGGSVEPQARVDEMPTAGAMADRAGADSGMVAQCAESDESAVLGVASARLSSTPPLPLTAGVQLLGDGLASTLMVQQVGPAGLRWQGDRMYLLADPGFWDIPVAGAARWYPTSTVLVLGVRAADLDGDGDQDVMLLSQRLNSESGAGSSARPFVTRLAVWERTAEGLIERSEVMRSADLILPLPYVFGDADGDANLDIISFEHGAPVAYVNDGSFGFARKLLGEPSAEYADKLVVLVDHADRNQDGFADLLVIAGEALDVRAVVLLGDGSGKLGAAGAAASLLAALVPHGPTGMGFGTADVTGDGLADILVQDPRGTDSAPILHLFASVSATTFAPSIDLEALGFEFADVDADGKTDIVTTRDGRLVALRSRGDGDFEARELGIDMAMPAVVDFVVSPSAGTAATVQVLYRLSSCPACDASCSGQCLFGTCVACLSDADCGASRCEVHSCVP